MVLDVSVAYRVIGSGKKLLSTESLAESPFSLSHACRASLRNGLLRASEYILAQEKETMADETVFSVRLSTDANVLGQVYRDKHRGRRAIC